MFEILTSHSRPLQFLRDQSFLTLLLANPQVLVIILTFYHHVAITTASTVSDPHIFILGIFITNNFRNISLTCCAFQESVRTFLAEGLKL